MVKVKVEGTDKEIEVDLHEPRGPDAPWFVDAGTEVKLTPEQFADAMADPGLGWDFSFSHEFARQVSRAGAEQLKASVRQFEPLRRQAAARLRGLNRIGGARGGKPHSTIFSVADDIAALATHYAKLGVKRQAAIDQATDFWIDGKSRRQPPAPRLIDAALARIRRGGIEGLDLVVEAIRDKYNLPTLPPAKKRYRSIR